MSGDLKDPAYAIPKGTLGAIGLTYITYSYFAVQTGFIFKPKASGVKVEYQYENYDNFVKDGIAEALYELQMPRLPYIDECDNATNVQRDALKDYFEELKTKNESLDYTGYYRLWGKGKGCEHGSALDQMTMTYTSFTGYLRYVQLYNHNVSNAQKVWIKN